MSRKNYVDDYAISLDIGNASVGWSAFTPNYRLVRAKGHELIGVRLFDCVLSSCYRPVWREFSFRKSGRF